MSARSLIKREVIARELARLLRVDDPLPISLEDRGAGVMRLDILGGDDWHTEFDRSALAWSLDEFSHRILAPLVRMAKTAESA